MQKKLLVIGGGAAGLSAAIYAARSNIPTTVLYRDGGALAKTEKIENYFGFPQPISGTELLQKGREQASRLGAKLVRTEVTGIAYASEGFSVHSTTGVFPADAIILSTGTSRRTPLLPGITEWEGRGVSYCAVCDAFFYRGQPVAVLGAGAYALEEAQTLLQTASSVTLLTNGEPSPETISDGLQVETRPLLAVEGVERVEKVLFQTGEPLAVNGVFIALGTADSGSMARTLGIFTKDNHILIDADGATNVPGIFAAGDCTGGLLQVVKAVQEGAQAALQATRFLRKP